ncbi:hypothetical protein [Bacillus altitudinis]|uniref:hypothetical protein n=1 Tax=Bacillus altitudinis TaxID=293387 RepID=UPI0024C0F497|nr:hypothetical protein [Bacillus altitudinis]WHX70729.1 hypothetical protein QNH40_14625 [Bacillus altitudinis]
MFKRLVDEGEELRSHIKDGISSFETNIKIINSEEFYKWVYKCLFHLDAELSESSIVLTEIKKLFNKLDDDNSVEFHKKLLQVVKAKQEFNDGE